MTQEERDDLIKTIKTYRRDLRKYEKNIPYLIKQYPVIEREGELVLFKIQESIMWLGKSLGNLRDDNPYPHSDNPDNTIISPEADNPYNEDE